MVFSSQIFQQRQLHRNPFLPVTLVNLSGSLVVFGFMKEITPDITLEDIEPALMPVLPSGHKSYRGRTEFIHELIDKAGMTDAKKITAFVRARFRPHASPVHVHEIVARYLDKRKNRTRLPVL